MVVLCLFFIFCCVIRKLHIRVQLFLTVLDGFCAVITKRNNSFSMKTGMKRVFATNFTFLSGLLETNRLFALFAVSRQHLPRSYNLINYLKFMVIFLCKRTRARHLIHKLEFSFFFQKNKINYITKLFI